MGKYDVKLVNCGNILEIYHYKEPICTGFKIEKDRNKREQTEIIKQENLQRSIKRTKRKIFELVNSNYVKGKSSFLTITFKENMTDYDLAFNYWDRFKKKVEYHYKFKLRYCGVVEFQERGSIHFHICLFNVPYLHQPKLYELWNSIVPGGINVKGIKDNECDNVGAYMTYYMNKDLENGFGKEEYRGRKRYFYSRNLNKPDICTLNLDNHSDYEKYYKLVECVKDNVVFEYTSSFERKELQETFETDMDTGEIKKELSENIVFSQELQYKQIVLSKNEEFRKNSAIKLL